MLRNTFKCSKEEAMHISLDEYQRKYLIPTHTGKYPFIRSSTSSDLKQEYEEIECGRLKSNNNMNSNGFLNRGNNQMKQGNGRFRTLGNPKSFCGGNNNKYNNEKLATVNHNNYQNRRLNSGYISVNNRLIVNSQNNCNQIEPYQSKRSKKQNKKNRSAPNGHSIPSLMSLRTLGFNNLIHNRPLLFKNQNNNSIFTNNERSLVQVPNNSVKSKISVTEMAAIADRLLSKFEELHETRQNIKVEEAKKNKYDLTVQKEIAVLQNRPLFVKCPSTGVVTFDGPGLNERDCAFAKPHTTPLSMNIRFA